MKSYAGAKEGMRHIKDRLEPFLTYSSLEEHNCLQSSIGVIFKQSFVEELGLHATVALCSKGWIDIHSPKPVSMQALICASQELASLHILLSLSATTGIQTYDALAENLLDKLDYVRWCVPAGGS